jgi:hypothetical protein
MKLPFAIDMPRIGSEIRPQSARLGFCILWAYDDLEINIE